MSKVWKQHNAYVFNLLHAHSVTKPLYEKPDIVGGVVSLHSCLNYAIMPTLFPFYLAFCYCYILLQFLMCYL